MKKIKILHIVPSFGLGGLENGVAKLANGLPPDRFKVDVLSFYKIPGEQFHLPPESEYIHFDLSQYSLRLMKLIKLFLIIHRRRYHIVHTHHWLTMVYGLLAARLAFVPVLIHGEHSSKSMSDKNIVLQRILALLPNHFTAICLPLYIWMKQYWRVPHKKITYIPNGVDTNRFHPAAVRKKEKETFIIGSVGRLEDVKNIPYLIKIFKTFTDMFPKITTQLLIVGDGSKREKLEMLVQEIGLAGKVIFTGQTKKPEDFYRKMDLYINPTITREGMNNCILEAMACGLPIITSDIEPNKSWLKENENTLFFNPNNYDDLLEKLNTLYTDIEFREKMRMNNHARVKSEFTLEAYINKNMQLYLDLLQKNT